MQVEPIADKWRAFGWTAIEIDGHDIAAVVDAMDSAWAAQQPTTIVAHTVKGKGVLGVEGTGRAHYTQLTPEDAEATLASLGTTR